MLKISDVGYLWFTEQIAANPAIFGDSAQAAVLFQRAQRISALANGGYIQEPHFNQPPNVQHMKGSSTYDNDKVAPTPNYKPPISENVSIQPGGRVSTRALAPTTCTEDTHSRAVPNASRVLPAGDHDPDPDPHKSSSSSPSSSGSSSDDSAAEDSDSSKEPYKKTSPQLPKKTKRLYSDVVKNRCDTDKWNRKLPEWAKKLPTFKGDQKKDDMRFRYWICNLEVQFQIFNLPHEHHFFVLMCLLDP